MLPNSWEVTNLQFEARVNAIIPTAVRVSACYVRVTVANHNKAQDPPFPLFRTMPRRDRDLDVKRSSGMIKHPSRSSGLYQ